MDRQFDHVAEETGVNLQAFLAELTDLSGKYGLGITGSPTLFVLEPEDRQFSYRTDDESRLSLG